MNGLAELHQLFAEHATHEGHPLRGLPNLIMAIRTAPTAPEAHVAEPVFSLILQGAKYIEIGDNGIHYGPGQYVIVPIELPMQARVKEASVDKPFLGFGLTLNPGSIASLLLEAGTAPTRSPEFSGLVVGVVTDELLDAVLRFVRLVNRPADIPVLAAAIEREILWRLLNGPQGALVREVGLANGRLAQIARAIKWLRSHYAEAMRIEELAAIASMSSTSFHRHFRAVTSMTPLQYQKQLRLQAARSRLIATAEDVAQVGFAVGYESPSQFSREYRRVFGRPPGEDGEDLRLMNSRAPAPSGLPSSRKRRKTRI